MTQDELQDLIDLLTHLEFCLDQLGSYSEAMEPSPVMLTHCAKHYLAKNTKLQIRATKMRLIDLKPSLYQPEF